MKSTTKRPALILWLLLMLFLVPKATLANQPASPAPQITAPLPVLTAPQSIELTPAVGEPVPRIQCPTGFTAKIYADGLSSPDGLAFNPAGQLYVAEELAGRVSRIEANGSATPVLTGLDHPEGIAFDDTGNLYVVEDVQNGRLIKMAPNGTTTLASNLDAPEGVAWAADGTIYITESNVEFETPFNFRTRVKAISSLGAVTTVRTDQFFWSYTGITAGPGGLLYVTNEASGTGTHDSVFTVNPATGTRTLFTGNLVAVEGLRFSATHSFPLFVAEEDTGSGTGKLTRIEANGTHLPFCTGFFSIEDVIQDQTGRLYVSEDTSGSIIIIEPDLPAQAPVQAIILFIGDGLGEAQRMAARWSAAGQSGAMAMDRLPFVGWAHTASANEAVTDSAAAATALATGVKTNNGMIGQNPGGQNLTTILEEAKARGMAAGLVTTTQMAHATPASFAAHVPDRNMMTEIAAQMLASKVEVLLGGGEDEFLPDTTNGCYNQPGERSDGRNLINEAVAAGYTYVCNAAQFNTVNPAGTARLLGLFADEGMARPFSPSLAAMTQKAIDILSQDPDGFFLMVEGGQIDQAAHLNDATNTIGDTTGFDEAVAVGRAYAATHGNTLLIVTADHETGGMSVSLSNGQQGPFTMPEGTEFYVNWTTNLHTGVDIPATAQGPWADLLEGTYENTHIYEVMLMALGPADPADASIGDLVWLDSDGNGLKDGAETGLSGITIYLDLDSDGQRDPGEPAGTSGSDGTYNLTGLLAGTYSVKVDSGTIPAGYLLTTGNNPLSVTLAQSQDYNKADFGFNNASNSRYLPVLLKNVQ